MQAAVAKLEELGAEVGECSLPLSVEYGMACYYLIAPAEASSNLARYDGVRYGHRADAGNLVEMMERTRDEGFGDEVKRRIMIGTYALSSGYYEAYYGKAQKVRTKIVEDFRAVFEKVDFLVTLGGPFVGVEEQERVLLGRVMRRHGLPEETVEAGLRWADERAARLAAGQDAALLFAEQTSHAGPPLTRQTTPGKLPPFIVSLLPEGWLAHVLGNKDERALLRSGKRYMSSITIGICRCSTI